MEPTESNSSASEAFFSFTASSPHLSRRSAKGAAHRRVSPRSVESKPAPNFGPDVGIQNAGPVPAAAALAGAGAAQEQRHQSSQHAASGTAMQHAAPLQCASSPSPPMDITQAHAAVPDLVTQESGAFVKPINLAAAFFDHDSPDQDRAKRPHAGAPASASEQSAAPAPQRSIGQQQPQRPVQLPGFTLGMAAAAQQHTTTPRRRVVRNKPAVSPLPTHRGGADAAKFPVPTAPQQQQQQQQQAAPGRTGLFAPAASISTAQEPRQQQQQPASAWPAPAPKLAASATPSAAQPPQAQAPTQATCQAQPAWPQRPAMGQASGFTAAPAAATPFAFPARPPTGLANQVPAVARQPSILQSFQAGAGASFGPAATPAAAAGAARDAQAAAWVMPTPMFHSTAAAGMGAATGGVGGGPRASQPQVMPTPMVFPGVRGPGAGAAAQTPAAAAAATATPVSVAFVPGAAAAAAVNGGDSGGRRGGASRRRPAGSRTPPPAARPPQPPRAPPSATSDASSSGSLLSSFTFAAGATPLVWGGGAAVGGAGAGGAPASAFAPGTAQTPVSMMSGIAPPSATAPWAAAGTAAGAATAAGPSGVPASATSAGPGVSAFPGFSPMSWSPSDSLASSAGVPFQARVNAVTPAVGAGAAAERGEVRGVQQAADEMASLNLAKEGKGEARGAGALGDTSIRSRRKEEAEAGVDDRLPVRDVQGGAAAAAFAADSDAGLTKGQAARPAVAVAAAATPMFPRPAAAATPFGAPPAIPAATPMPAQVPAASAAVPAGPASALTSTFPAPVSGDATVAAPCTAAPKPMPAFTPAPPPAATVSAFFPNQPPKAAGFSAAAATVPQPPVEASSAAAAQAAAVFGQPAPAPAGAAVAPSSNAADASASAAPSFSFSFNPAPPSAGPGGVAPVPVFNIASSSQPQGGAAVTPSRRGQRHKRTTPVRSKAPPGGSAAAAAMPTPAQAAPQATHGLSAAEVSNHRSLAAAHKETGNTCFQSARYSQAETYYSLAIQSLEAIQEGGIDLAVLLSNRAGARLMIGRPLGALEDARRAVALDPKFIRAVVRVATCHLRMGEFGAAHALVDATLDRLSPSGPHFADVQRKMREVDEAAAAVAAARGALLAAAELPKDKLSDLMSRLDQLHPQVLYSEEMAALRARTLLQSGQLSEALKAVEVTYEGATQLKAAPWRLWLEVQVRFLQGDLSAAVSCAESLVSALASTGSASAVFDDPEGCSRFAAERVGGVMGVPPAEGVEQALAHLRKLLKLKEEGNTAVKSKQLSQAVDTYTSALTLGCSAAFAAVLHSNRAAAHQGLGNLTDALADCGRARALDPGFVRAHTRMATLLLEARRCDAAQAALEELTGPSSGQQQQHPAASRMSADERAGVAAQLTEVRAAARWQRTPDHYRLLGLPRGCGDEDVRRSYRKAALKYHPDKALAACKYAAEFPAAVVGSSGAGAGSSAGGSSGGGAAAVGSGVGGALVLRMVGGVELETRLREEATALFNLINQANEELADRHRRAKVDQLLDAEAPGPSIPMHTPAAGGRRAPQAHAYASSAYKGAGYGGFGAGGGAAGSYTSYRRPGSTYGTGATGAAPGSASYARYFNQNGAQAQAGGAQRQGTAGPKQQQQQQQPPSGRWGSGFGTGYSSWGYGSDSDS